MESVELERIAFGWKGFYQPNLMRKYNRYFHCVRVEGLEPPRREALDPKSSVSTNSTTSAERSANIHNSLNIQIEFSLSFVD